MSDDVGTPKAITETQERILRAAMEIMAERGDAATPTAERSVVMCRRLHVGA